MIRIPYQKRSDDNVCDYAVRWSNLAAPRLILSFAEQERFKADLAIARVQRHFSPFHCSAIPADIEENAIHELSHMMALGLGLRFANVTYIGECIKLLSYADRFRNEHEALGCEAILLRALDVEEGAIVRFLETVADGQSNARFSLRQCFLEAESPRGFSRATQLMQELREQTERGWELDDELRQIQIHTDGRTLWINGPNGLLGRLGPRGIDVHAEPGSTVHCLDCGPLPAEPWEAFKVSMKKHHGVLLGDQWEPLWSKNRDTSLQPSS